MPEENVEILGSFYEAFNDHDSMAPCNTSIRPSKSIPV